jgi:hypothetical protein
MTSVIGRDPMRTSWDTIQTLAILYIVFQIKRIRWEHGIIPNTNRYRHLTACLNTQHSIFKIKLVRVYKLIKRVSSIHYIYIYISLVNVKSWTNITFVF